MGHILVILGKYWNGWWLWAVLLFFFARKHPPLYDEVDAGGGRMRLGLVALALFILCFTVVPMISD